MAEVAEDKSGESEDSGLDCPICLQAAVHPVELPCGHIFCYLCIKGVSTQRSGGRCAICRTDFPNNVLLNPRLKDESQLEMKSSCKSIQWFYEARSGGWWMYDERTMAELETAYIAGQRTCQALIAGHIYEIDFIRMIQFRANNPAWSRRIKRDQPNRDETRGVAGIRLQRDGGSTVQNQTQTQLQHSAPSRPNQRSPGSIRGTASASGVPNQVPLSQPDQDNRNVQVQVVTSNENDQVLVNASSGVTSSTGAVASRSPYMTRTQTRSSRGGTCTNGVNSRSSGSSDNSIVSNINRPTSSSSSAITSIQPTNVSQGSHSPTTSSSASRTCLLIGPSVQLTFDTTDNTNDIL